ncbi:hypothetical protein D5R81_19950 [Parashewanella spongiae]|uniref:Uncharacterized protein n=1 Tax=Parashewanella spongiae TaxID=342950 RepID=A0A3A6T1Q6_9GAMM|nr:hypothetical protein D5R81_19950 [Parashewanella spongiae]
MFKKFLPIMALLLLPLVSEASPQLSSLKRSVYVECNSCESISSYKNFAVGHYKSAYRAMALT